tara:strand:+ start:107 stop:319 length:213 start_codon:yes stop_codon:yes gene_type:complete
MTTQLIAYFHHSLGLCMGPVFGRSLLYSRIFWWNFIVFKRFEAWRAWCEWNLRLREVISMCAVRRGEEGE